jgi:hypothetical protein
MRKITSRTTIVLAAALFVAAAPSIVMAQEAGATPGNTTVGTYSGPPPGGEWPLAVVAGYGGYFAGVGAGNGAAGVAAGTLSSSGQQHSVNVGTYAPGEACILLPGTNVPYDCPQ